MADPDRKPEADVEEDRRESRTRAVGGVEEPEEPDQASVTGTTPNEEFVGRSEGADTGFEGETGAERRAEAANEGGS